MALHPRPCHCISTAIFTWPPPRPCFFLQGHSRAGSGPTLMTSPQRHHVFQDSTSNSGHVHLSFCGGGTIPRHWWDELGPWASDNFGDHLLLSISRRFPSRAPHLRGACEVTYENPLHAFRVQEVRLPIPHPQPHFLTTPPATIHTSWAPGPASSHQVRCRGDLVPWGSSHTLGTDAN